ncbi:MAG: LytTR family DNA-binding domain-containing protein [Gemmatimonadetes bacterium]|nr:LytTR family DNA-binding domain-containing protein [Gemmatimonadota bacterium]
MLRLLLVDDEPLSRRALRQLLDLQDDVEVVAECADVATALPWLDGVDGVLLDIEMPGDTGLALARARTGLALPAIVFVTAFDRYALPAFATEALDYLCKPVTAVELARALARVRAHVAHHRPPSPPAAPTLIVRTGRTEERLAVADIDCVEADDVYAAVYIGARRWLVRQPLAALAASLPSTFLRVHRRWIVQRRAVRALRTGPDGLHLLLHAGRAVPVSRRSAAAVRAWLRQE